MSRAFVARTTSSRAKGVRERNARLNTFVFPIEPWSEVIDRVRFGQTGFKRIGAFLNNFKVKIGDGDSHVTMVLEGVFS